MRLGHAPLLSGVCPAVEALLAHERTIVPCTALLRARSFARARHALLSGPPLTLAASGGPPRTHRLLFGTAAGIAILTSAAGAYQLGRRSVATPRPIEAVIQPRPATVSPLSPPATHTGTVVRSRATAARAAAPVPRLPESAADDAALGDELRLLELAREAAVRGSPATVVAIATEHASRYPISRLAEEREALRLQALIALGRRSEARLAAERFRSDFPRSVLLGRLEEMLASRR